MAEPITFERVRRALALQPFDSAAAQRQMAPVPRGWQKRDDPPQAAAVLILIYADGASRLKTLLTLRSAGLRGHSGQVSFPGGRHDPLDESLNDTALRETCEEIGLCGERLAILGQLPRLYIPASHHCVLPVVARYMGLPACRPNPAEVAEVLSFALDDLLRPRFKSAENRVIRGYRAHVPYYAVGRHKVWGATAMLLSELEGRLRAALAENAPIEAARALE